MIDELEALHNDDTWILIDLTWSETNWKKVGLQDKI